MVLKGSVASFKYYSEANHFGIFYFDTSDISDGSIVVTGNAFGISEGDYLEITGEEVEHPVYGHQIKMTSYRAVQPTDTEALIKYLASGALRGVGPKLAQRIFVQFGEETLNILENEPERLAEVKGISVNSAQKIAMEYEQKKSMRDTMMLLQKYNISNRLAAKLYEKYGPSVNVIILNNPYKIAEDIVGVGFKTVDEIAKNSGLEMNSPERIGAGIQYCLKLAMEEGHTYLPRKLLIEKACEVLEIDEELAEENISNLIVSNKLTQKNPDKVFLKKVFRDESYCAGKLRELKDAFVEVSETEEDRDYLERRINDIVSRYSFELDESQKQAIHSGIENGIFLLTGGPGTGKTTIIKALIDFFYEEDLDVVLAAPTGRAAKRMSEATEFEAKTLHRLLEAQAVLEDRDRTRFMRNENNLLEADVYIIDEMSMVDVFLFSAFLKAVPIGSRIIMAGDVNQLPSVGPGNIFKDLIQSGFFATATLEKIHRQAENSRIVENAHLVNKGICPPLDKNAESTDFFFLELSDRRILTRDIIDLLQNRIPAKFNVNTFDIQVMSPSRRGDLGVETLNPILQKYLNPEEPGKAELFRGDTIFRVGDKVMQIKNNYDIPWVARGLNGIKIEEGQGVYNGDTGRIDYIDRFNKTLTVIFDEVREVTYTKEELEELEHAYAITVHKAQGSEYPAVIIPLLDTPRQLLNRNLFYTAITRATECVMIMGSSKIVGNMVENDNEKKRYTDFATRLKEVMDI